MSGRPPIHIDDEERLAAEMGRELEAMAAQSTARPPAGFVDRVMAAVANEPLPQPARAFGVALAGRHLGAALASVVDAWRVVVGGPTPIGVRAQALALVLVVTVGSLLVAGGAAVGAIDLLNASPTHTPSPTTPLPSEPLPSPSTSPSPSPSVSPERSPDASPGAIEAPERTETPGATQRSETVTPSPTATGTDDHGGGSGGGGIPTPSPTGEDRTPSPTATGTDDHGGGPGGGDG